MNYSLTSLSLALFAKILVRDTTVDPHLHQYSINCMSWFTGGWVNITGHRAIIGFLNPHMYLVFLTSGGLWRKMTLLMSLFIVLILVLASLSSPLSLSPSSLSSTSSSLSPSSLASSTARQHIKVRLGGRTAWDNIDWTSMTGHNGKGYFSSSFKLLLFCIF